MRFLAVATLLLASLASAALLGLRQAHAANPVLTFDDLSVPAGGRETVNTQYTQGVTFNNVSAIDYSSPGFAHSDTVGIEQCFAAEFCTTPITVNFTVAQRSVKVWVGASFPLAQPLQVRLTAFDASHVIVGATHQAPNAKPRYFCHSFSQPVETSAPSASTGCSPQA